MQADDVGELRTSIISLMLISFSFSKFNEARWASVGVSCRGIIAGLQLGLALLMADLRAVKQQAGD